MNSSFNSINNNPFLRQNQNGFNNGQNNHMIDNYDLLDNYQELPVENQNYNFLNSFKENISFNNYDDSNSDNDIKIKEKYCNNENISDDNLIKVDNPDLLKEEENNKFLFYLMKHNFITDNNILEKDISINKEKNSFDKKVNNTLDKLKCQGCSKIPKDFFLCPYCKSLFCENCLGEDESINKNIKFCINCNKLLDSKEHFIKIPIFNKIASYINSIRENNEKLYNNKKKDNLYKNMILCNEDVHNNNEYYLIMNSFTENKNEELINNQMKAIYFCMECLKPFCSDCILKSKLNKNNQNENITDNNTNNIEKENLDNIKKQKKSMHNFCHPIFRIDLLNEAGIFDLLYEKDKFEKIINDLDSIDQCIKDKIEYLNKNKENMILFLDYIKNIYIQKVEEIVKNLKKISQEKMEKIETIKQKSQELYNFLNIFKTKKELKNVDNINNIKKILNDCNSFHKVPYEMKEKTRKLIKFKGLFDLKDLKNCSFDLDPYFSEKKFRVEKNKSNCSYIKINLDNNNLENNKIRNGENNINQIIEEKKVSIIYTKGKNYNYFNSNKKKNIYSFPILINSNKINEFISFKELPRLSPIQFENNKIEKDINIFNYEEDCNYLINNNPFSKNYNKKDDFNEIDQEKKYLAEINIKDLKKNNDKNNINFNVFKFNVF